MKLSIVLSLALLLFAPTLYADLPTVTTPSVSPQNPILRNYALNDPLIAKALLYNDPKLQQMLNTQVARGVQNLRDPVFRANLTTRMNLLSPSAQSEAGYCASCEISKLQNQVAALKQLVAAEEARPTAVAAPVTPPVTPAIPVQQAPPAALSQNNNGNSMVMMVLAALSQIMQQRQQPTQSMFGNGTQQNFGGYPQQNSMMGMGMGMNMNSNMFNFQQAQQRTSPFFAASTNSFGLGLSTRTIYSGAPSAYSTAGLSTAPAFAPYLH